MQRGFWILVLGGLIGLATGCGGGSGPETTPVAGNITIDGQPAGNAVITFIPDGDTKGNGATGTTDSTGRYVATTPQGSTGAVAGKYKVTVSRRLNPDGSPPAPGEMPIESQARETLPPKYSDAAKTELSLSITPGDKRSFDFALTTVKKK